MAALSIAASSQAAAAGFEVWLVDQSNSAGTFGGKIHIFEGDSLMGSDAQNAQPTDIIDLGQATSSLCFASTGVNPVRPHMLFFNSTHSHAVLSFVVSGHVVIFDARTRAPVSCLRASAGVGGARQAHAAIPAPDDSYILVANQNGKLLERIDANYAAGTFTLNSAATVNLATCTTPNGAPCQSAALRPDNAPICPVVDGSSSLSFVTLRGGGLFVVNPRATPMEIIAEYDRSTIHPNGCGGTQAGGSIYLTSGGGTATNLHEFDVYQFPLRGYSASNPANTPAPTVVFSDDVGNRDAHGTLGTKHDRYLWVFDRLANVAEIFDVATGERQPAMNLVNPDSADPSPDLAVLSPAGNRIFVSLRGGIPLSGDPHASTGSSPGMAVIQVNEGGRSGEIKAVVRVSNVDSAGVERADPHGIGLRRK
ncbi:MAG: hypothetical protein M3Y59_12065 [Myxococcota bacterium]|nr:hypothetical protein [Myxococcota bacterium]